MGSVLKAPRLWACGLIVFGLGASLARASSDDQVTRNSSKLMLRTSGGLLKNVGQANAKTAVSAGGINLGVHYFLTEGISAGVGYKAEIDLAGGSIPLKGIDLTCRWYPWGQGTYTSKRWGHNLLEFHSRWAPYVVTDFSQRSYYLARVANPTSADDVDKGAYFAVNSGLGVDIRISRHFEWNFEAITSLISFAAENPEIRIKSTLLNTGLNFVW